VTLTVTHAFTSAIADDPVAAAAGEVLPSHWNAGHVVSGSVSITINTTPIVGGTSGLVLYDNAGTVGEAANFSIISGNPNVPIGAAYYLNGAPFAWFDNNDNAALGNSNAGNFGVVSGSRNLSLGRDAGSALTSGSNNMIFGADAGGFISTGNGNAAIGHGSLGTETSGTANIAIGDGALHFQNGRDNSIAIGGNALNKNTTGASNTAIGTQALQQNTTGANNIAIGFQTANVVSGSSNVIIGVQSGDSILGGNSNTFIGHKTGRGLSSTDSGNTFIGFQSGTAITSGSNNTFIGGYQGPAGALSGAIALSDGSGTVFLDYNNVHAGNWTVTVPIVHKNYTVGTLPTGVTGAVAYITDGDAGLAWGATAVNSGAGATKYLVWYNGANWTVVGK
jgi:hypothetical protein